MVHLEELQAVASRKERAAVKRLVNSNGWAEEAAMKYVMQKSAGAQSLDAVVSQRQLMHAKFLAAIQFKEQKRSDKAKPKLPLEAAGQYQCLGWFDGSAHPNPGKIRIGGVLKESSGNVHEISMPAGEGDSNEAEYLALIAVLQKAISLGVLRLTVFGDSQVIIHDVQKNRICPQAKGAQGLETYRATVCELLAQFEQIELRWIPRHKNSAADRLSQQAAA